MGLLQKAVETFDCHAALAGKIREGHEPLVPVSHLLTRAQLEITVNAAGECVDARAVDKSEEKIIIPVTEASAGRTSAPCAHPLCDQLGYLMPQNDVKYGMYVEQLEEWASSEDSHPLLAPILTYVKKGMILADLTRYGLITCSANGLPSDEKMLVRWRVAGLKEEIEAACWKNTALFDAFRRWYEKKQREGRQGFCMIMGEDAPLAGQHPKGIIPINGNAKLISANDSNGYTYRGRFAEDWQAATVSYRASQKAHNALRWLVSEQGTQVVFGGRTFLCWNPQGKEICTATGAFRNKKTVRVIPGDYRKELRETLAGYRSRLKEKDGVVIAVFDAATTGRLALTYYNELVGSDFLQRLYEWDSHCCWHNWKHEIESPLLVQIVNCAYGTQRLLKNGKAGMQADDKILRQQMQTLVACRVDRARIPSGLKKALTDRASSPVSYEYGVWRKLVYTACAVQNKYIYDQKGEDVMSWELDKPDRSFQFGRLLATMERAEADFYRKTENDKNKYRQTNAMKYMSVFRQRPWHIYEQVNRQLNLAYLNRIESWQKRRYEKTKGEIVEILRSFPEEELNQPLEDIYLMGYDCQRNEFFKSKEEKEEEKKYERTEE